LGGLLEAATSTPPACRRHHRLHTLAAALVSAPQVTRTSLQHCSTCETGNDLKTKPRFIQFVYKNTQTVSKKHPRHVHQPCLLNLHKCFLCAVQRQKTTERTSTKEKEQRTKKKRKEKKHSTLPSWYISTMTIANDHTSDAVENLKCSIASGAVQRNANTPRVDL
jgi:hypothetical protein